MRLREWADRTETGDRDELKPGVSRSRVGSGLGERGRMSGPPLPAGGGSALARWRVVVPPRQDIVITNHALLAINAFEGMKVLPEHETVIIDEAHGLVDQ